MFSARTMSALLAPLVASMVSTAAMASLPHPGSWRQVSDDARYVLVMLSPLSVDEDTGHPCFNDKEIQYIRTTYSQSGLYHNDGSATPIWTLPYHARIHEVFIGPRGKYLVIADDDWYNSLGHVVSFYSNGNELRSYHMFDLVSSFRLKSLINGEAIGCGGIAFDADALTFVSSTNQGEEFAFDVTTGTIIRRWSPFPIYFGILFAVIAIAVIVFLLWMRRKCDSVSTKELPESHAT